ncbi:flagellar hook-basal body complex protein FliE [Alcaligenaceae bacterium CGII-47]|nr:flagellar hook-basal body complex protein FliE [Alcaligenaceae bacterium CGII-47]
MSAQSLSSIENMLAQMRAVSRAAQGLPAQNATPSAKVPGGFAAELARSLNRVSEAQNAAAGQARAFELGDPGVSLNNVMIDLQKANLAFQGTVQVRNRLVDAYKEIANMAV